MKSRFIESKTIFIVTLEDDDGEEYEQVFPAKFALCFQCEGRGTHVHTGIDSHGITPEEFADDPEFREDYFDGVYDVSCEECNGKRVIPEFDEDACSNEQKKALQKAEKEAYEDAMYEAECRAERAMGY